MNDIKLILKGVLIGIGKVIPGVSGSMIAISLGVYEKLIFSISNIFTNFKKNSMFLFKIGIGIMISIIVGSKIIYILLNKHYLLTMLTFIGLIIGGIPTIVKEAKKEINIKNIIALIIPFIIFFIFELIINNIQLNIKINSINAIWLGFIEALSMIIPGISGTAIMMILGVYDEILLVFSDYKYFFDLIFLMFGIVLGFLTLSKIISFLLNKYKITCYYSILGFVLSSVIILLKKILIVEFSFKTFILGIILLMLSSFISYKLE